jgi:hypothetical protein
LGLVFVQENFRFVLDYPLKLIFLFLRVYDDYLLLNDTSDSVQDMQDKRFGSQLEQCLVLAESCGKAPSENYGRVSQKLSNLSFFIRA